MEGLRHQPRRALVLGRLERHNFPVPLEEPGTTQLFAGGPTPTGSQAPPSCLRRRSWENRELSINFSLTFPRTLMSAKCTRRRSP